MKSARKIGGNYPTPLNTPIVIHKTKQPKHVTKDEILKFLDQFIAEKETLIDNNVAQTTLNGESTSSVMINMDTNLTSALSQLKRIQRDFKGLPPTSMIAPPVPSSASPNNSVPQQEETKDEANNIITKSATGGTKKKFSDDD